MTPEKRETFRAALNRRLQQAVEDRKKMKPPEPAPRYDDIFWQGLEWLNSL
jgi:hypothetical protein